MFSPLIGVHLRNIKPSLVEPAIGVCPKNSRMSLCSGRTQQDCCLNNTGPTGTSYENLSTLQRRLFSRVLAAANVVANRGRRGPANFIVTNANLASAMQDISQFTFAPFSNTLTQNNGTLYPVGSLAGMTVYVDQNMQYNDTRVCVGRKGGDDEPGLKFMPYMMAESIQTISEGTMSPKIAVKSRYALVEAGFNPESLYFTFYVSVPVGGLN